MTTGAVGPSTEAPSPMVCLQPQAMANQSDLGSVSVHVMSGWTQSAEAVACSSQPVTEQMQSTCKEEKGCAFEQQQQQQQQQQQSCDARQQVLGQHTPNYPKEVPHHATSDQKAQRPAFATVCSSAPDELQGASASIAQSSQQTTCATPQQRLAHERPHTVQRFSDNAWGPTSSSALLQPARHAALGSRTLQDAAALQHNAAPSNSQLLMHRPLARRVVKTQIQLPAQHERSTFAKSEQLQLSRQLVHRDTSLSGTGEREGLVTVPTMICYPPTQPWVPRSFIQYVGDPPVEQMGVDSQCEDVGTCAPQEPVETQKARAKKPKKRLCPMRKCGCC
mmetsp:Transcript_110904/g.220578  ORF Transcript_110904/g.220578 Transcript_110904/m.220578 type:complete len:335 (+) Transcript_110904:91-1095(+)